MVTALLEKYPIISDQIKQDELEVILFELEQLLKNGQKGSVVEFGCYIGTASLFITRLLDKYSSTLEFHVYDSFEGLPEKTTLDNSPAGAQFVAGTLKASKKEFITQFKKANLMLPTIHKGWFNELTTADVPSNIMFAFLDGDYYESIKQSLLLITPQLQPGAVIVVDDYANEALPGAGKAVDEWCNEHATTVKSQKSLGIIRI